MAPTEPLDLDPSVADRLLLAAAAEHYCKRLDNLAEAAAKLGRSQEATDHTKEAARWRDELVEPVVERGDKVTYYSRHMLVLEHGCMILARNMRAAKGTVRPFLIFDETVERFEKTAEHTLNVLSVMFTPVVAGQAAGEPMEQRQCPECNLVFSTAVDSPEDQACVTCLAVRGEEG